MSTWTPCFLHGSCEVKPVVIKKPALSSSANSGLVSLSTYIEEPDRQGSLEEASQNLFEDSSILKPGKNAALLSIHHQSLVDLIQEDLLLCITNLIYLATEDSIDLDVLAVPSSISSIHISNQSDSATNSASVVEKGF